MAQIIAFPPKTTGNEPKKPERTLIWTCYDCGNQTFYLHETAETECADCGKFSANQEDKAWRERLPPAPEKADPLDHTNGVKIPMNLDLIKERFRKAIKEDDVVAMAVFRRSAFASFWCEGWDTEEQRDWFLGQLEMYQEFLKSAQNPEEPDA
jgi:ribosomal protein L37E